MVTKATSKAVTVYKPKQDSDAIKIGKLYQLACASLLSSQKYYIECGKALIAKKAKLGQHGTWLPWLKANADVLGFDTRQTAHLLMKAAANDKLALHLNEANAVEISRAVWGHKPCGTLGTGNDEWNTPGEYLAAVREVLGTIDLDPASNVTAQRLVKASRYYTEKNDGLSKQWRDKVFMNPPYSQPADFVNKLCEAYEAGHVTEAIMLTNSFSDTQWFHRAVKVASVFCLTEGRIGFIDIEGNRSSPTMGQTFFYFGNRPQVFSARFAEFGFIATAHNQKAALFEAYGRRTEQREKDYA